MIGAEALLPVAAKGVATAPWIPHYCIPILSSQTQYQSLSTRLDSVHQFICMHFGLFAMARDRILHWHLKAVHLPQISRLNYLGATFTKASELGHSALGCWIPRTNTCPEFLQCNVSLKQPHRGELIILS